MMNRFRFPNSSRFAAGKNVMVASTRAGTTLLAVATKKEFARSAEESPSENLRSRTALFRIEVSSMQERERKFCGMLLFGDRNKLAEIYQKWIEENNVMDCALSVITWLAGNGLLKEEEAFEFVKNGGKTENE